LLSPPTLEGDPFLGLDDPMETSNSRGVLVDKRNLAGPQGTNPKKLCSLAYQSFLSSLCVYYRHMMCFHSMGRTCGESGETEGGGKGEGEGERDREGEGEGERERVRVSE